MNKDDAFHKRLLATFKVEAEEHIAAVSSGLIELEKIPSVEPGRKAEVLETIFRETHSFKGAARAVDQTEIGTLCQSLENTFASMKHSEILPSPELVDLLHKAVDDLSRLVGLIGTERASFDREEIQRTVRRLEREAGTFTEGKRPGDTEGRPVLVPGPGEGVPAPSPASGTVRIAMSRIDSILLQTEELLSAKLSAGQRAAELREIRGLVTSWEKEWARVSPGFRRVRESADVQGRGGRGDPNVSKSVEFLERNGDFLKSINIKFAALEKAFGHDRRSLGSMIDSLLDDMKKVLMLPLNSLLELFPKLVRDLSHVQGKSVVLTILGGDIEMERRILEEIKDPLIHLIRNCIDHGIEKPEERADLRKPVQGNIKIEVMPKDGGRVEVAVSDDGRGIDLERIKASAVKTGVLSSEEVGAMAEPEALDLIFISGLSTSPMITDLSGRGLGLAIVREKVEKLGGLVSVEVRRREGTTFKLALPVRLATFRGVLVRVGEHLFVFPTTHVQRVLRLNKDEIKTVENRETVQLGGKAVSFVRTASLLGLSVKRPVEAEKVHIVLAGHGERGFAFLVDEILGEQEVLVKGLGRQLSRVRNIAAATVLGTGKVVPILNVDDLMKSAVKAVPAAPVLEEVEEGEQRRKSVLVVEDSITARILLKNILEAAGYSVKTAVDGLEGYTALRSEEFDLVVSDVDMPRMNGFDLTARIRSDKRLSELPVVLVTALDSREDRERGIDVGANAYIVKSSFDQSNLLEVIKRLI